MTTILGVSCLYHDAAAAVVRDGEIIAAAQEERFTRKKHDRRYPEAAIAYCIDQIGGAEALDAVVFYEDPVLSLDRILKNAIELAPATGKTWAAAARSQLGQSLNVAERLRQILPPRAGDNVFFVDHHLSHAASAFYPSPFREAAIVVADGIGEWASTTDPLPAFPRPALQRRHLSLRAQGQFRRIQADGVGALWRAALRRSDPR